MMKRRILVTVLTLIFVHVLECQCFCTHASESGGLLRKFRCVDDLCDFVRRLRLRQGNIMRKGQW